MELEEFDREFLSAAEAKRQFRALNHPPPKVKKAAGPCIDIPGVLWPRKQSLQDERAEMKRLDHEIRLCETRLARAKWAKDWFRKRIARLNTAGRWNFLIDSSHGPCVFFDYPSHQETDRITKKLGGEWGFSINDDSDGFRVDVLRKDKIDGMSICCWAAEPPPNCELVETMEEVLEHCAARIARVRKIVFHK